MTKQDYVLIAMVIRQCGLYSRNNSDAETMRLTLASHLATAFRGDNPRFDSSRFLKACNAEAQEIGHD